MIATSRLIKIAGLAVLLAGAAFVYSLPSVVKFESEESRTLQNGPIYNAISWQSDRQKEVWSMRQSHQGLQLPADQWDELQIVVDKSQRPYRVSFHQMRAGREVEYRASCYLCHSNGPRAIRPVVDSPTAPLNLRQRAVVALWNLRVKTYGPMVTSEAPPLPEGPRQVPLLYSGILENAPLNLATCNHCHNNDSRLGRGQLRRQHYLAIGHLVRNQYMPPFPFKLSPEETRQLQEFIGEKL